jgi:hypothetical protein
MGSALTYDQSISWDILSDSALINDQSVHFQLSCEDIYLFSAQLGYFEREYLIANVFPLLGLRIYPVLSYIFSIIGFTFDLLSRLMILNLNPDSAFTVTWFTSLTKDRNTLKLI